MELPAANLLLQAGPERESRGRCIAALVLEEDSSMALAVTERPDIRSKAVKPCQYLYSFRRDLGLTALDNLPFSEGDLVVLSMEGAGLIALILLGWILADQLMPLAPIAPFP